MQDNQQPIPYLEFAKRVKEKYPEYAAIDDLTLSRKMVDKFPEYKSIVVFDDVKKKDALVSTQPAKTLPAGVSPDLKAGSPSQSQLGLVDDISMMPKAEMLGLLNQKKAQYNEFKNVFNTFDKEGDAGVDRRDGVVNQLNTAANDLNYIAKTFKEIYGDDKALEDVEKMTPVLNPAEDPRQRISDEFKQGLAAKKKQFYNEQGIPDAETTAIREVNDIYNAIKLSPDYNTALKKTSELRQQVFDVTAGDGESREKLLSKLRQDAFGLGQFLLKDPNAFKNTGGLTPAQKAGLDYIKIFEPERYDALAKRATVGAETEEQRVGQQINNLELENIGLSMLKTGVSDMYYRVQNRLNQGIVTADSPEVKNINSWIAYVKKAEQDQLKKYPEALAIRAQQVVNDVDKERLNFADRFSYNFGSAIFGTVDGLIRSAVKRFMGEDDQTRSDLESVMRDSYSYLGSTGQNSASIGRDKITVFSDRLKSEFSKIDQDTKLSREEKFLRKSEILKGADPSEVYTVINPDASKININAESVLGILSTVVPQIVGGVVMSAATGGFGNVSKAKQLANIFTTSFASSYGQGYDSEVATGAADADFKLISKAFINGALEAGIGNDISQIKKLAGNGVVGKALSKLSDNDWSRIMAGKSVSGGAASAVKDFTMDLASESLGEGLTTIGENAIDGAPLDRGVKETVVSTIIGMGAPRLPIIPFTARGNNMAVKYAFYSGGFNKAQTISAIKDQINSGDITEQEGNKRIDVVTKMNGIINTMPFFDKKGNPLSDEAKAKYAYNEYIKQEAKAAAPNMPTKQAEELKEIAKKADEENGIIIDGPQSITVESGMAVDQTGQLINKKQQIKEKFGFGDEAFAEETYTPEEDAADREALPESEFKTEEELINFLETGEYAMLTGQNPDAVPLSKEANRTLNQKATEWLAARGLKPTPLFGKYGNSERSFFVPNMTKEQSIEFAKEFQQDSVAHSSGLVYKDGSFNPRNGKPTVEQLFDKGEDFFSSINIGGKKVDFRVPYDLDTKMPAEKKKTIADEINEEVLGKKPATIDAALSTAVDTASKSLEKAGIKFSIIDSSTDQSGAARGNQAIFKSDTGEIIIDKSKLKDDIEAGLVVWHEAAHPVMNILRNTDKSLYDAVVNGLQSAAGKNKGIADALGWAQENYGGEATQNDEAIVETIGRINAGIIDINSLDTGLRQKLIDFINAIAKALGLDQIVSDTDIAQFKKTVSEVADALKTGRDVAEIVGEGNVKEYMNTADSPESGNGIDVNVQLRVGSEFGPEASGWLKGEMIKSIDEISKYRVSRVIFYDNTRVGNIELANRVNGEVARANGMGGFGYSYIPVVEENQGVLAFTSPNQAIQVLKRMEMFPDSIMAVAMQNQLTSHLGNITTMNLLWGPKGVFELAAKTKSAEKEIVRTFKESLVSIQRTRKNDQEIKAIQSMIDDAKGAKTISDIYEKVMKPSSFGTRNIVNSNMLQDKPTKVTASTRDSHKLLHYKYGVPTLQEIADAVSDNHFKNAETGDIVKYVRPFNDKKIYTTSEEEYNRYSERPTPEMINGGYTIELLPSDMSHESYPFVIKGENIGFGESYVGANEVFGDIKEKGITKSQSFFPVGRMKADAAAGAVPADATRYGSPIQASAGNRNLIPESKQKKLTDDGKGNYVFFHRTAGKLNKIDPKKFGSNTATGRDERPGVGISMFYVDNKTGEPGVPSNFIYAVRVPKEKVYPINEDPLNLYDEAKEMFEKDYPGQAFDANKQVGYITKVANNKGFDMTIIDWNIKGTKAPRAQTTVAMKPEKYKTEEFVNGSLREVYNPELEKLKPGIKKYQASVGNRLAPNGKPSNLNENQWNQVRTPEFKAWFGDWENDPENASKVVDENGEPRVMYHGTAGGFDVFQGDRGSAGHFAFDEKFAEEFANTRAQDAIDIQGDFNESDNYIPPGASVIPVFINARNIFDLRKRNRLGIDKNYSPAWDILERRSDDIYNSGFDAYLDFESGSAVNSLPTGIAIKNASQVKSAIGNSGAFSTTDNRIQASAGNRTAADFGESADPKTKITLNDLGVYPGMSSQELLDSLIKFGGTFDPLLKAIAKKDLSSLQIADMKEITDDPSEAAGGFLSKFTKDVEDRFKGKLYINTQSDNYDFSTKNQYYTLTHELMHWVTLDSLDTPVDSPAYDKLKSIYDVLLKNADTTPGFGTFETYGLSNFNEFMAELFISAKFRDYVKDVMGTNEDLRSLNNESKDLITLLVDYLKGLYAKIFGETGPIDESSPLIDQATRVAKDMFFGDNVQASLGKRKLEQDQDFKLAAYVMRKKSEGTPIAEIAMGIMSAIPGMTVQEVNDLVSDPEQYIRTKFKYLSPALLENLISRAGVKNIYKKSTTEADPAFDSLEVDESMIEVQGKKNKVKEKIREVKSKYFDAAKGMPNWVLALKDITKGVANLEVRKAIDISKDLKKAAEAIGFTDWDAFSAAMKSLSQPAVAQNLATGVQPWYANIAASRKQLSNPPAVQPAEILALPEEIRPFVFQMRGAIDGLTKDLIASGFVTPEQAQTLEDNIGQYTNRAYRIFNEKGHEASEEDIRGAIKFLADQYVKQLATEKAGMLTLDEIKREAIEMANKDVKTILDKDVNPYFKRGDSRDTGILKERKDIPAPIRKLMGEYTDPATVFVMTVAKQAALKSASQYLTGLRNTGMGSIFFEKNDPNRPASHSVEIATDGSESKNPLGGLFTTPEIAESLNAIPETVNDLTNAWMKVVGAVRWSKTVGSVVTQVKNFLSNIGFAVMNGLVFSGENGQALKGAGQYWSGEVRGKELTELAQKAMSLGLVNQSVGMSELREMLGSGDVHDIAVELAVTGKSGKAKNWIGKTIGGLNKAYQLSDDFWKVYAYMNERQNVAKAMFGTRYESLTTEQQASVDIESSERVKNTWPTYDRVWEGAKYVSQRAPIFGNFVSFQAESVRVLGNTIKLALRDIKSDNPEFQAMGYKRLAGMITYVTLRSAITYAAAHAAGVGVAGLLGLGDDEEEKIKEEGIKNALPGFMRTSDLLVIPKKEKGQFTVFDLSSLDPYGVMFKSLNALTEGREGIVGDKMEPGVAAAMAEFMSGFLEPEMTFKTMMNIANNTNEKTGGKIFMEDDSRSQALLKAGKYAADQLKPSTIGFIQRLMGDNKIAEVSAVVGARPYEVDLTRSFGRIISTNGKNFEDIIREYNRVKYDPKATKEEKKAAEKEAEESMAYYAAKMNTIYNQFLMLGADPKVLDQMIVDKRPVRVTGWNKSIKKAVRTGKIESEKFLK